MEGRLAAIRKRLRRIEDRLSLLEGGAPRLLRAAKGDGRARTEKPPAPHCPGCSRSTRPGTERCPRCGMVFSALPARLRPGGSDNPAPAKAKAPGKKKKSDP